MNKSKKVIKNNHYHTETHKRSVVKSVLYRILMVLSDFGILYLFIGEAKISISFAVVNNIYNTLAYYGYDRLWNKIRWGKIVVVEKDKQTDVTGET